MEPTRKERARLIRGRWTGSIGEGAMKADAPMGIAAGMATATVSMAANLWRADPHLVSAAPDATSAVVLVLLIYRSVRHASRQARTEDAWRVAIGTTIIAAATCAASMGMFTWWYLPSRSLTLAFVGAGMTFGLVAIVGITAAYVAVRSDHRVKPTAAGASAH